MRRCPRHCPRRATTEARRWSECAEAVRRVRPRERETRGVRANRSSAGDIAAVVPRGALWGAGAGRLVCVWEVVPCGLFALEDSCAETRVLASTKTGSLVVDWRERERSYCEFGISPYNSSREIMQKVVDVEICFEPPEFGKLIPADKIPRAISLSSLLSDELMTVARHTRPTQQQRYL